MLRTVVLLFFGLACESVGNVLLRKGMKEIGYVQSLSFSSLVSTFLKIATNLTVIAGVALDALFFGCLLIALSWAEVSVVLPLTAMGYLTTAITAKLLLHEDITLLRWVGTITIVIGCMLVGKSGLR
jgi:drug/metabolite transporter (DMT)-like permease